MVFLSLLLFFALPLEAQLSEVRSDQNIAQVRYLNPHNDLTVFQNYSGELILAQDYDYHTLIKASPYTHFTVFPSPKKDFFLISTQENFHAPTYEKNALKIYLGNFQKKEALFIDQAHSFSWINSFLFYYFKGEKLYLYNIQKNNKTPLALSPKYLKNLLFLRISEDMQTLALFSRGTAQNHIFLMKKNSSTLDSLRNFPKDFQGEVCFVKNSPYSALWNSSSLILEKYPPKQKNHDDHLPLAIYNVKVIGRPHCQQEALFFVAQEKNLFYFMKYYWKTGQLKKDLLKSQVLQFYRQSPHYFFEGKKLYLRPTDRQ